MSKRRFNGHERASLYLSQDGHCALCGVELEPGWHADHMQAWSKGGPTDTINGQALCPTCNLRKGSKDLNMDDLRDWQKRAIRQYHADNKQNWLLYVTPGGGKTRFGLTISRELLDAGIIDRVVVVVPTDAIRTQWTKQHIIHLAIVTNEDGGEENHKDFQGCVVSYQSVASMPDLYRRVCSKRRTLVIFDEVHHAGDAQSWGKEIVKAFASAVKRISMTGTPWRSPRRGNIPFVTYNDSGEVVPDFSFTYKEAVQRGVCRPIQFYGYDGEVTYVNIDSCVPQSEVVRLGEAEDDNTQVLRDILRTDGKWMFSVLREGVQLLNGKIQGDNGEGAVPDAKGIVIVHDRAAARAVARLLERVAHERPALIISDPEEGEPNPQEELARFSKDQRRWAVAVDMVTEGVDIPSLCVGVYATRKKTPLRFRQIVGRFIRQRTDEIIAAALIIPATPSLKQLAGEIENDLLHIMDEETEEKTTRESRSEPEIAPIALIVRSTSDAELTGVISEGTSFSQSELRRAAAYCEEYAFGASKLINVAKMLRAFNPDTVTSSTPVQESPQELTRQEEKTLLLRLLDKAIGKWAGIQIRQAGIPVGEAKKEMNASVFGWFNKPRKKMSIEELRDALRRVEELCQEAKNEAS